jgi:exosortase A
MNEAGIRRAAVGAPVAVRPVLGILAGLFLVAVAAGWPSVTGLADLWSHPERRTYQHGYLIAGIVLWLVWRDRRLVAAAAGPPSVAMLLLTAVLGLAWAVAWNAGLQAVHFIIWPAILWAGAAAALGFRAGLALLRPMAFFAFALPLWDALNPVLQRVTVLANEGLALLFGMPVIIDGTLIHIPEGSFEIAGGCSGLNYFVVGLAVAALLGELNRDSAKRRLFLIALSGALALLGNWLRVFIIIYAGHVSNMTHYLVRVDHYKWGWVLYSVMLVGFFLYARRLPPSRPEQPEPAADAAGGWRLRAAPAVAAAIAIGLGPAATGWHGVSATQADLALSARDRLMNEAAAGGLWQASAPSGNWLPVFTGADAESMAEYARGEDRVTVFTATYLNQRQGRELVGHDSRIEGAGASRRLSGQRRITLDDPEIEMIEADWRDAYGRRAVLWWVYRIGTEDFASGMRSQLWYGLSSLWSSPVSGVVALHAECQPDCDRARITLRRFAADALPQLLAAAVAVDKRP